MTRLDSRSLISLPKPVATLPSISKHDVAIATFLNSISSAVADPKTPNKVRPYLQAAINVLGAHSQRGDPPQTCLVSALKPLTEGCANYLADELKGSGNIKALPTAQALYGELCEAKMLPHKILPFVLNNELCGAWSNFSGLFSIEGRSQPTYVEARTVLARLLQNGGIIPEAIRYIETQALKQRMPAEAKATCARITTKLNEAEAKLQSNTDIGLKPDLQTAVRNLKCVEILYLDLVAGLMIEPHKLSAAAADARAFELAKQTASAKAMGVVLDLERGEQDPAARLRIRSLFIEVALPAKDAGTLTKAAFELNAEFGSTGVEGGQRITLPSSNSGRVMRKGIGSGE